MRRAVFALWLACLFAFGAQARGDAARAQTIAGLPVVKIAAGRYSPLYAPAPGVRALPVAAYWLMTRPVTNAELLAFLTAEPSYRRDRIARVFAETQYLAHWAGALELGSGVRPAQPVTHVSWFVARAFCASKGLRLPTEAEWELAAAASRDKRDGSKDAEQRAAILRWYGEARASLPEVPSGPANYYGVHDLHSVAWEWVEDFNNAVVVADSREGGASAGDRFCGAAAAFTKDATDYASFMRVAMRSSLEARYTGALLTFRCAADVTVKPETKP
jgi:formylglycine-generating enzyme required for sulfatase activity